MGEVERDPSPSRAGAPSDTHATTPVRRIHSRELLGAAAEIEIEHAGQIYRLRRTSLGKLILTK
jgi:hemin uptake protein HemP